MRSVGEKKMKRTFRKGRWVISDKEFDEIKTNFSQALALNETLVNSIERLTNERSRYSGNAYKKYETAVKAIEDKYVGNADWGVELTGNVIDLRAAFIIGSGVSLSAAKGMDESEAKEELEFLRDVYEFNKLDAEMAFENAKEAEIEGKIAFSVKMEDASAFKKDKGGKGKYEKLPSVRFIPWADTKYVVTTEATDYLNYKTLTWKRTEGADVSLSAGQFVYNKFGGRVSKPNQAEPKIMKCLPQIDDVSHALRDWREINHLFAAPIFDVEVEDTQEVGNAAKAIEEHRMNIRKAFVHSKSKLKIQSPPMGGVDSLKEEIIVKIKIISGTTGIPVHFLGLLDLLKNRATGDNTRELINAGTDRERQIWIGTYNELNEKCIEAFNDETQTRTLEPSKVKATIAMITQEQWDHIADVFLPMFLAGALSIEYILSQVPGVNVEDEMKRLDQKEEDKAEADRATAEREAADDEKNLTTKKEEPFDKKE